MSGTIGKIYENHHSKSRDDGFSVLKSERGILFSKFIGVHKNILDLGCRDGALTSYYVKYNNVLGIDIDELSLGRAKKRLGIKTLSLDIQSEWYKLENQMFDVVVAGEFLEHVYFPDKIVQNVSKILDTGGLFIGSVPNAYSIKNRIKYFFAIKKYTPLSDPTHINHFSLHELRCMLEKHFALVNIYGLGRLGLLARLFPNLFSFDLCFVAFKLKKINI